jgi:exodeoxyribonuclease V alpha subunit
MSSMISNPESEPEVGLDVLAERETTRELDEAFAAWTLNNFYPSVSADDRKLIGRLSKAVSYALHLKHTCLDLNNYAQLGDPVLDDLLEGIDAATVLGLNISTVDGDLSDAGPLLCSADGHLLWLQKYHVFEQAVMRKIANMNPGPVEEGTHPELSDAQIKDLDDLYGSRNADQRNAVETTLTHRFSIITGGPGTGKTYTVARIITLMLRHGVGGLKHPRIALAAPTGKAANTISQA